MVSRTLDMNSVILYDLFIAEAKKCPFIYIFCYYYLLKAANATNRSAEVTQVRSTENMKL